MTDDCTPASPLEDAEDPFVPFDERRLPRCDVSDEMLQPARGSRPERERHDGWTPERIRIFLHTLAACGVVADSARAAGMSVRSAYYLRTRAEGGPFDIAWTAALQLARRRLADAVVSRALHGCVEVVMRDGEVWGERHRFDNRLTMQVLTRLDRLTEANDDDSRAARFVVQGFSEFVEIVSGGGIGAAEFIAARERRETPAPVNDAARSLQRLDSFWRYGARLSEQEEAGAARTAGPDASAPVAEADDPAEDLTEAEQAEALRRYRRWKAEGGGKEADADAAAARRPRRKTPAPKRKPGSRPRRRKAADEMSEIDAELLRAYRTALSEAGGSADQ